MEERREGKREGEGEGDARLRSGLASLEVFSV
jgi:hypothetical protein